MLNMALEELVTKKCFEISGLSNNLSLKNFRHSIKKTELCIGRPNYEVPTRDINLLKNV
jgi:hypothetical protein